MTLFITYPKIEIIETCGGALESIQENFCFGSLAPHNGYRKFKVCFPTAELSVLSYYGTKN